MIENCICKNCGNYCPSGTLDNGLCLNCDLIGKYIYVDWGSYGLVNCLVQRVSRNCTVYASRWIKSGKRYSNDTGKFYIGGTANLRNRLKGHLYAITRQSKSHPMTNDVARYGLRSVSITILEMCNTGHDVIDAEKKWQHKFNSVEDGYNETYGNVNDYAWRSHLNEH